MVKSFTTHLLEKLSCKIRIGKVFKGASFSEEDFFAVELVADCVQLALTKGGEPN